MLPRGASFSCQALQLLTQGCLEAAECLAEVLEVSVCSPLSHPGIDILTIQVQSLHDMGSLRSHSQAGATSFR